MKLRTLKTMALVEVLLVFTIAVVVFNIVKVIPAKNANPVAGYPLPYFSVMVVILLYSFVKGRSLQLLGLLPNNQKIELRLFVIAVIPTFMIKFSLFYLNWQQWNGALIVSLIIIISTLIVARASRKIGIEETSSLFLGLFLFSLNFNHPSNDLSEWAQFGYRFLYIGLIAFTEEAMFRGFIFENLKNAFRKNWGFCHIQFNVALLISSLLFGLWHALNGLLSGLTLLQCFLWLVWTFFMGIFLCVLRMKSKQIVIPSILHWIINI